MLLLFQDNRLCAINFLLAIWRGVGDAVGKGQYQHKTRPWNLDSDPWPLDWQPCALCLIYIIQKINMTTSKCIWHTSVCTSVHCKMKTVNPIKDEDQVNVFFYVVLWCRFSFHRVPTCRSPRTFFLNFFLRRKSSLRSFVSLKDLIESFWPNSKDFLSVQRQQTILKTRAKDTFL